MEWILLNSMFLFFSTVQVTGLPPGQGVCKTHQRYVICLSTGQLKNVGSLITEINIQIIIEAIHN